MSDVISCSRSCTCPLGGRRCRFTDRKRQGDLGCNAYITLPPIEELLDSEALDDRKERFSDIRQAMERKEAMLALGAGVSIPADMPSWLGLLSQMTGYALQYRDWCEGPLPDRAEAERLRALERDLITEKLRTMNGVNPLEAAEYINIYLKKTASGSSSDELTKAMISGIIRRNRSAGDFMKDWPGTDPKKCTEDAEREAAKRKIAEKDALCAVTYLLQAEKGFRRAITYNYDTLVQEYLIDVFGVEAERIVAHAEGWTRPGSPIKDPIELFHVHGCLPRPGQGGTGTAFPQESRRLILSEESYYDMELVGTYNWQNSIQSYYLNRDTCVFVGFSADDYSFRRILRLMGSGRESERRPRHYLILTVDELAKDVYASVCRSRLSAGAGEEETEKDALSLLAQELKMKATYWRKYNFIPIWVTINDIPRVLLSLLDAAK